MEQQQNFWRVGMVRNKKLLTALLLPLILAAAATAAACNPLDVVELIAFSADQSAEPNAGELGDLSGEVFDILEDNYVEPADLDLIELYAGAVDGLLRGIAAQHPALESFTMQVSAADYPLPSGFDLTPSSLDNAIEAAYAEIYADIDGADEYDFDISRLAESTAAGLIRAVDDPYTSYLTVEAYMRRLESLRGEYEGIGAYVNTNDAGQVYIVRFLNDSPAREAGLMAEDAFHSVGGSSVVGLDLNEVIAMIRGPAGTDVRLGVIRTSANGDEERLEFVVERRSILLDVVTSSVIEQDGARYGVIEINSFGEQTESLTEDALCELTADMEQCRTYCAANTCHSDIDGIIVDLRSNPGGYLHATINTLSLFLDDDDLPALYESNPEGRISESSVERRGSSYPDIPLVILVSEASASGAEVFTGALRDHGRAIVSGAKTFGKGSVNRFFRTDNEGALYVTINRWYTPCGDLIEGVGITPEYEHETPEAAAAIFAAGAEPRPLCTEFGVSR